MAKVVPLASAKAFLDALQKSTLLNEGDVAKLRESRSEESDPKLIARDLVREGVLTKWQAGQLLHGFFQLTVGKYKLLDQIGSGEMGRVYLAEHSQLARKASLKILSRKHTANPEVLKRFLEDGRQASRLDHRNLTHVFDVNSEDERYYLVTEYVEGKDLRSLVEAGGATAPVQAIDIIRQAAEGLEHAHTQGVVHGDLKPSNLIIDSQGIVKILDLGLARLSSSAASGPGDESTEMATLAARAFHAPEQIGKNEVSPLGDIYSLGAVLYYVLVGKSPLGSVKSEDIQKSCPVSDELAELCARMLTENPSLRPQSAREVIFGLDAVARAKPKPVAKETKKAASDSKQRKPLVAKALEIPFPSQAAAPPAPSIPPPDKAEDFNLDGLALGDVSKGEPATNGQPAPEPQAPAGAEGDDPFSGFAIQTRRKKQKPAAAETPAAPGISPVEGSTTDAVSGPANSSRKSVGLPVVIGVGVGGGVLIIALGVTVLIWVLSRGGEDKIAVAKAEAKQPTATATPSAEANPEANPEVNPEVNPTPAATPATTTNPGSAAVNPKNPDVKPATPMPATPMPPATTTPMPATPAATTTPMPPPMPKPEPAKTEPVKPEPVKPEPVKPAPMPEPVVPVGNPFAGFAKIVPLPPLEEKGKVVAEATKPVSLGAIKLPPNALCVVNLLGGENAIFASAKQKFELKAGNNGTSGRDWDIKLAGEGSTTPILVARLEIENDQLNFHWTDEATRQLATAPFLCNCVLSMSAGSGSHQLALRQPLTGEALKIDLEKPMSAKYTLDYPPNPKQIVIQLGPPEGKFPKFKFEKPELTAKKDTTVFTTGPGEEVQLLHLRLDCLMTSKLLKIDAIPQFKLHGMNKPDRYLKTTLKQMIPATEQASAIAIKNQTDLAAATGLPAEQKATLEAQTKKEVEDTAIRKTQAAQLQTLIGDLQGQGKIHFHIYYEADSETQTKVVLLSTGAAPPMAAEATK